MDQGIWLQKIISFIGSSEQLAKEAVLINMWPVMLLFSVVSTVILHSGTVLSSFKYLHFGHKAFAGNVLLSLLLKSFNIYMTAF